MYPKLIFLCLVMMPAQSTPKPIDAKEILHRHLLAVGGAAPWRRVTSVVREAGIEVGDNRGTAVSKWKAPYFFYHQVDFGPQTVLRLGTDGMTGWMNGDRANSTAVLNWKTYTFLQFERYAFPESGVNAKYHGIENVNGRPAYVVALRFPFGAELACYYDVESYYLVKDVSQHSALSIDDVSVATVYSDFRPVGNVVLPFRLEEIVSKPAVVAKFEIKTYKVNPEIASGVFSVIPAKGAN
jgi:hypothetical protein